jgi:hypothetical protein
MKEETKFTNLPVIHTGGSIHHPDSGPPSSSSFSSSSSMEVTDTALLEENSQVLGLGETSSTVVFKKSSIQQSDSSSFSRLLASQFPLPEPPRKMESSHNISSSDVNTCLSNPEARHRSSDVSINSNSDTLSKDSAGINTESSEYGDSSTSLNIFPDPPSLDRPLQSSQCSFSKLVSPSPSPRSPSPSPRSPSPSPPSPSPSPPSPACFRGKKYVVQIGDSYNSIAQMFVYGLLSVDFMYFIIVCLET